MTNDGPILLARCWRSPTRVNEDLFGHLVSYPGFVPDTPLSSGKTWRYRFARPGGDEVETGEFTGDEGAIGRARELSTSMDEAIVVQRYGLVDWHYVDEVDERP
jgi:hypothetical protein